MPKDTFRSTLPPIGPPAPVKRPTPAPAWVAFAAAWGGLLMLIASVVFTLLPGSHPRQIVEKRESYGPADRFLPFPIYGITLTLFLGIVVLWQMRREPRPLPAPLATQRVQAWVGIVLALLGAAVIYAYVAWRGPR